LLGDQEVRTAFGARDLWQVIEQVSATYLGGARNVTRYRTQANAGRVVFDWLAAHAPELGSRAAVADSGGPIDFDLVNAAEQWLAVGGVAETSVEQYSQPIESPTLAGPRAELPSVVRELLQAVGLSGAALGAAAAPEGQMVIFHGAPGTGKTLAAHVLAGALARDIHRVDLARVISKYIGETEKNLNAIFDAAARSDAVLLIDEADALLGKRSEVKDAHDRYANLDVNHLLQRIEEHPGLVILTTNLREHIDRIVAGDAWRRRAVRVVRFPRPWA